LARIPEPRWPSCRSRSIRSGTRLAVLKDYAAAFDANLAGWSFLTGDPATVLGVAHRYGVAVAKAADSGIDHTPLTTLIDRAMRVQYIGYRFDPEEFRHDLLDLVNEP
jgi:protein SCO1/2